jgi:hypothetical protein
MSSLDTVVAGRAAQRSAAVIRVATHAAAVALSSVCVL